MWVYVGVWMHLVCPEGRVHGGLVICVVCHGCGCVLHARTHAHAHTHTHTHTAHTHTYIHTHTHTHSIHTHTYTFTLSLSHTHTHTYTHTHTRTGLGQELFPRAVVTLRQMVQELLHTLHPPLDPPSRNTKTQPNSTTPQRFGGGGWGAGTRTGLEVEVGMCAVELGRVVCHWMRSLSTVRCALSMVPPAAAAVWCRVAGGASDDDDQALNIEAPLSTVLANLVYVSVLWSPGGYVTASASTALPPPAAGEGEDGEGVDAGLVADDLHAALLSGLAALPLFPIPSFSSSLFLPLLSSPPPLWCDSTCPPPLV